MVWLYALLVWCAVSVLAGLVLARAAAVLSPNPIWPGTRVSSARRRVRFSAVRSGA